MPRSVKEWIGKTDDSQPPTSVRLRVFQKHDGICHISGRKIIAGEKWELEHIKALADGGENRESNLAPALVIPHRQKTAEENKSRAKVKRKASKHFGAIRKAKWPMQRRYKQKIDGTVIDRVTGKIIGDRK